jgi:peptidoglycan/LPS O-acetylase OafA/YrhL
MGIFSSTRLSNEKFPALTGVRAIAAFMVFFHHLPLQLTPNFLVGLQLSFYWGVDLFFVLSGFLITYRYYKKTELKRSWLYSYFINRFARIYPVYFLVLTIVIVLAKNFDLIFLLQNYTLTHYLFFIFKSHGMAITASWSLTVEECFYVLAPFIFILCKKYNFWLPLLITFFLLVLLLLTYRGENTLQQSVFLVFSGSFFGCFLKFFAGVYLALIVLKKEKNGLTQSKSSRWTLTGIATIAILLIPLVYVTNKNSSIQFPVIILVNNFLMPFPIAMLYYGLITENSLFRRGLSGNAIKLFGRGSYAFYLLHVPLITYLAAPFIRPYFSDTYYNLYVILVFIITLALSVIVFIVYERPINIFIRERIAHRLLKKHEIKKT